MEYQQYQPSHYPGQPHIPVRRKRVTLGRHFKNQWNNSRGFFKQWWGQKTDRQPEQPNNYSTQPNNYPTQTGSGISRPRKRRQKHYQYGGLINPNLTRDLIRIGKIAKKAIGWRIWDAFVCGKICQARAEVRRTQEKSGRYKAIRRWHG